MTLQAIVNAIGCAVPGNDIHRAFVNWGESQLGEARDRALFRRMVSRSGIEHRWSVLRSRDGASPVDPGGFYDGALPPTSERMRCYAHHAPQLALEAVGELRKQVDLGHISHVVVASCTGFVAPGIDQMIARAIELEGVERTLIGFMGCYAAVAALRTARHIVRSEPDARVLVVTVELSSLHLQEERQIDRLLMMLQFGDGAAAALVTAEGSGFAIERPFAFNLDDSADLITWAIGDHGFIMHLSGEVPARIQAALEETALRQVLIGREGLESVDSWAVHAGGRSILDAVARGLELPAHALDASRGVLARFGNMSSATLLFVLADLIAQPARRNGVALAFGPGLAAEGFRFVRAG